jgi:lipopolysaccharide/colanic/teichoic acid biosynthesis glycosyltransferase
MDSTIALNFNNEIDNVNEFGKNIQTTRVVDTIISIILFLPASLLIGVFYLLYLVTIRDGGTFLYKGQRMGHKKKIFNIYKIRSLVPDAEKKIGGVIYEGSDNFELWYGKYIRKTRIDELPQLLNIIKGDLAFVGPRPIRPKMYETTLKHIPGYDSRFNIKPGLAGYSQFITPHNTLKKIRNKFDFVFDRNCKGEFSRLLFILLTIETCFVSILTEFVSEVFTAWKLKNKKGLKASNLRKLKRTRPTNIKGSFVEVENFDKSHMVLVPVKVIDLNLSIMRIESACNTINDTKSNAISIKMYFTNTKNGSVRVNSVLCKCKVIEKRGNQTATGLSTSNNDVHSYLLEYEPVTDLNKYTFHKYLLKTAVL